MRKLIKHKQLVFMLGIVCAAMMVVGLVVIPGCGKKEPVSRETHGGIITWEDNRSGNIDIYAQRVNPAGSVQWTGDGVGICTAPGDQKSPQITSDGSGGAVITWEDNRSGNIDIYAQRVNPAGSVQWTADGVAICTDTGGQYHPRITSDGSWGAIITWEDWRSGNIDTYAQRVNGAGAVQWGGNGVAICTASNDQFNPQITTDGSGGAIITWVDNRSGVHDIYAQRVNPAGSVRWTGNGVVICTAPDSQHAPQITSDGSGGAIITWEDRRSGSGHIYAQRVDGAGAVRWTGNGVWICTDPGSQWAPKITSDGSGGAIITWADNRLGSGDIYAQRVDGAGTVQWKPNGVAIFTASGNQEDPQITSDGSGGAIVTWNNWPFVEGNIYDIYAQRVDAAGTVMWTVDGVSICTDPNSQSAPQITSDGSGGAIVTWEDNRSGNGDIFAGNGDIYAQRVDGAGASQWTGNGVAICTDSNDQYYPQITSD